MPSKLLTFPYALSIPVIIILVTWLVCRYFFRKKKSQSSVTKSSMVTGNTVAKPINDQKVNKPKPSKVEKVNKSKPSKVEKVNNPKPSKERDLRKCNFSVSVGESESIQTALRRFKEKANRYGLMAKLKELKFFIPKSKKRHKKKQLKLRKQRKQRKNGKS